MSYAKSTSVPIARSRDEIEQRLQKAGASAFGFMSDQQRAAITFMLAGRQVRCEIPLPEQAVCQPGERPAKVQAISDAHAQECRRRWRCMLMSIKAKLIAIEEGISTVDREFMPDLVLSDNRRLETAMAPELLQSRKLSRPLMLFGSNDTKGQ